MALSERALVDTSIFYALSSSTDAFHERAVSAFDMVVARDTELWTTSYALVETVALIHNRLGFEVLSDLLESFQGNLEIFWVDETVHEAAWKRFAALEGRGLSFVDWTLAVAAAELGAPVFTVDSGFAEHGIAVLRR